LAKVWHTGILIFLVLGSIYLGVATPTKASALRAIGAFLIAGLVYRNMSFQKSLQIIRENMMISVAILLIMGCAKVFGEYLNMVRVPGQVTNFFMGLNLPTLVSDHLPIRPPQTCRESPPGYSAGGGSVLLCGHDLERGRYGLASLAAQ
jgi:hypothetical protein